MELLVKKWLAVARYYSAYTTKAKIVLLELSKAWGEVQSRGLGDNKLLLEFAFE